MSTQPPSGPTLGTGFKLLAQAVILVAKAINNSNQLTILRMDLGGWDADTDMVYAKVRDEVMGAKL